MADKTSIWKINNVNILESLNSKLLLQMYMINLLVVQKTEIKTCIETQYTFSAPFYKDCRYYNWNVYNWFNF